jgi:hypothetical protein
LPAAHRTDIDVPSHRDPAAHGSHPVRVDDDEPPVVRWPDPHEEQDVAPGPLYLLSSPQALQAD